MEQEQKDIYLVLNLFNSVINNYDYVFKEICKYYFIKKRHNYHEISKYINKKIEQNPDMIIYMQINIKTMIEQIKKDKKHYEEIILGLEHRERCGIIEIVSCLDKLYDHISLEDERIRFNSKTMKNSTDKVSIELVKRFNESSNNLDNKVQGIMNNINMTVISIVGIFSAIIFVFFGGISNLSSSIGEVKSDTDAIRTTIMMCCIVGFIIFNTVFLLIYSISKIVDKNIGRRIMKSRRSYYYYDKDKDDVFRNGYTFKSKIYKICFNKFLKKSLSKFLTYISNIKVTISNLLKLIFLRFPFVTIIDLVLLASIIYFYRITCCK